MNEIQQFYHNQNEPNKSCFLFLRQHVLDSDKRMEEKWKWKLPFFYYNQKPFCYLWKDKKTNLPYVCFVRSIHITRPEMELGNRKQMKAITIDPNKDIDLPLLDAIIQESLTKFSD